MKKTYFLSALAIIAILILSVLTGWFWASSKPPDPEKPEIDAQSTQQVYIDIEAAVLGEVEIQKEGIPLALLYDTKVENIQLSNDTNWATAWMTPVDPETGLVVPTEPGLVILRKDNGVWIAFLPSDPLWMAALEASPDDLIPPQNKITYLEELGEAVLALDRKGWRVPDIVRALCGGPMLLEFVTLGQFSRRRLVHSYLGLRGD